MIRTFRYPLRPNKAQTEALLDYLSHCQQLYNAALQQRKDAYRTQKKCLSLYDQYKELAQLRQGDYDFAHVPSDVLRSALQRLDRAFKAFFRRTKAGETPGFPRFKSRDRYKSFSLTAVPVIDGTKVIIPKLGLVKFHRYRPLKGAPRDASVRLDSRGWWVCIQCDLGNAPIKCKPVSVAGVDVGLETFATLSTGEKIQNPRFLRKSEVLLAQHQQTLSHKQKGSNSRRRQQKVVARTYLHIRNQRLDFAWKLAKVLLSRFDAIAYEDLNIRGMVRSNLAKSINDAAWGLFIHCLICKAEEAGKWAVAVDPRGTSQRCSRCGKVCKKTLADRVHLCDCGPPLDRDHNAAINILGLGQSLLEAA